MMLARGIPTLVPLAMAMPVTGSIIITLHFIDEVAGCRFHETLNNASNKCSGQSVR